MKDFSNVYLYFQKALEVNEKVLPLTHILLAVTHTHMARILSHLHRDQEAFKNVKQVLEIACLPMYQFFNSNKFILFYYCI
jgi:hypothetical protein